MNFQITKISKYIIYPEIVQALYQSHQILWVRIISRHQMGLLQQTKRRWKSANLDVSMFVMDECRSKWMNKQPHSNLSRTILSPPQYTVISVYSSYYVQTKNVTSSGGTAIRPTEGERTKTERRRLLAVVVVSCNDERFYALQ